MKLCTRILFISFFLGQCLIFFSCENEENLPGMEINNEFKVLYITIGNITCVRCVEKLETTLRRLDGVVSAQIFLDRENEQAEISFDDNKINEIKILKAINEINYTVVNHRVL